MTQTNPLPSLFGRFTAILQQHHHLGKTLRHLRVLCVALEEGQDSLPTELAPGRLLVELRVDLARHFGAEEAKDYFGTVVDEMPALAPQIGGLKWEHMTLLQAADALCQVAADPRRWLELPAPTRELIAQLERHERAESALLRKFFA